MRQATDANPFADLGEQHENPLASARIVKTQDDYHGGELPRRGAPDYPMSYSALKEFARCPHRWVMGYEPADTDATDWGSLLDCLLLTPQRFAALYAVQPDTYAADALKCPTCGSVSDGKSCRKCKTDRVPCRVEKPWNNNSDNCRAWCEQQEQVGKRVVSAKQVHEAEKAAAVMRDDKHIAAMLDGAQTQVQWEGTFKDEATGIIVPLRGMIDIVPQGHYADGLADLKSCQCAAARPWSRKVYEFGYHVQAALYVDAFNLATGGDREHFYHLVSEAFRPYEAARRVLTKDYMAIGRGAYTKWLRDYCDCLRQNVWPGYEADTELQIDGWAIVELEPWMVLKDA